jgi:hypothetical protein
MKKLLVLVAAVVTAAGISVTVATASSKPIVIPYTKTCNGLIGHCFGSANGVTIEMWITSFRPTGDAAQLTLIETVRAGNISFTAVMNGHNSPAGFIVLNGTVTDGSFAGAQVHQRSNYLRGPADASEWEGELRIMPATG